MDALAWTTKSSSHFSTLSVHDSIIKASDIIDMVIGWSDYIRINLHQCKRLVDFYKRARPYLKELQRSGILVRKDSYHLALDALDDGRCLVACCKEWNWISYIRVEQDAFARIHVKLEDSFRLICENIEAGVAENCYTHHEGLNLLLEFDTLAPLYFLDGEDRATLFERDAQMDKKHMLEFKPGSILDKYMLGRIDSMPITTDRLRAALNREQGVVEEALLKNKEAKLVLIRKLVEGKKEVEGPLSEIDLLYNSERLRRKEVEQRLKNSLQEPLKIVKREKDALAELEKLKREMKEEKLKREMKEEKLKAAPSSSTGTDLLQDFRIQTSEIEIGDRIGSGSFATIHKCQWQNRDYALKMFKATDVEELRTEVQNLVLLPRHPNVVLLVGFSIQKTHETPMLLMELLDGDLHSLVCEGEPAVEKKKKQRLTNKMSWLFGRDKSGLSTSIKTGLSTSIKIDFIYQIAKGMLFLHKRKVFHGDLKAKNVLVKQRPGDSIQLKITDFGVSEKLILERQTWKKRNSDEELNCSTFSDHSSLGFREIRQEGNVQRVVVGNVGTVRWMAPEVYRASGSTDTKPYSMKADVYSFSMTCIEILTGQHPFPEFIYPRDVKQHVKRGGTPDVSTLKNDIPVALLHLLKRCWDVDPESRPDFSEICSSMQELKKVFPIK